MIFFLIMPGLFGGFSNYFILIFIGSPEVIYPRINNLSIFILFISYIYIIIYILLEFGSEIGWTLYPPLSISFISLSPSNILSLIYILLISGISSYLTSINFWIININIRSYSITLNIITLFPYNIFIIIIILLLTLPILTGTIFLILYDLYSNTIFFDIFFGGDPIFYQHLFWFFGHPEVYILIIPAFGFISIIISIIIQIIIFGNQSMIIAILSISIIGNIIWVHHMYTINLESDTRIYFTIITIFISLPTSTKIYNWLCTYLGYYFNIFYNYIYFIFIFLLMFTIGGSTGIILGNSLIDIILHDTYYIVTHFHFILSLGAIITIFSGIIFNYEIIFSISINILLYTYSSIISIYYILLIFISILLSFLSIHLLGFNLLTRRIMDYPDSIHSWNFLSSIGSGITFLSFAIFLY
jgi:cytochrome c oxidase subunit 1